MKTASVGEIQKNFPSFLKFVTEGDEITITSKGKPVAKIISIKSNEKIEWPDFYDEAIESKGISASDLIIENREERF